MYTEEQKINSVFIKIALIAGIVISIIGIAVYAIQGNVTNAKAMNEMYIGIAITAGIFILVYTAIFRTTLEIALDAYKISISYFPFLRKPLIIEYDTILSWQRRKIKGIFDYGGYGYQKDIIQKKTGFIMGGKEVFELKLKNGKKIGFTAANADLMYVELTKLIAEKQIR